MKQSSQPHSNSKDLSSIPKLPRCQSFGEVGFRLEFSIQSSPIQQSLAGILGLAYVE